MEEQLEKLTELPDGVYDITGMDYMFPQDEEEVKWFLKKHKKAVYAHPYETDTTILLSAKPKALSGKQIFGQFNYGAAAVIEKCPQAILICAQND